MKYLAAAAMKELLTKNVGKVPARISSEKLIEFKEYFMQFLKEKGPMVEQEVLKMVITLLSKLVKLSWFDEPDMKGVVSELLDL